MKQPWEKLGLTETAYLLAYTQGFRSQPIKYYKCTYEKGSPLRKAYNQGKKDAKRGY